MTTTPAEYRQYAVECLMAARFASRDEMRATLLSMAQRRTELAERAEVHAHLRGEVGVTR